MRAPTCAIVVVVVLAATMTNALAQTRGGADVNVSLQGIASWQPVDDTYVGSPYLDKGLGGSGPGLALGVDTTLRRFVFAFEYSRAAIDVMQTGRLVNWEERAEGQLRDSLFSFAAGASAWSSPEGSIQVLAGLSVLHGQPRQNGTPIDAPGSDPAAEESKGAIGFTAGANFVRELKGRIGVVASARYSVLPRSRRAEELGVGPHVFRFGGGVRIRLTD